MEATKVSTKYQIVIPKKVREKLKLKPGQQFQVVTYGNRIELIPVQDIGKMRGYLRGIDTDVERGPDRL
jgi:AbrB family looped-hinge helix DNA binding protein